MSVERANMRFTFAVMPVVLAATMMVCGYDEPAAPSQPVEPQTSTATFIRAGVQPYLWSVTVKIDGRPVATLRENRFAEISLPSGSHQLSLTWPALSGQVNYTGPIELTPGQPAYFRLDGEVRYKGKDNMLREVFLLATGYSPVSEEEARQLIAGGRLKAAKAQ
jgi:hypothetical protein